MTIPFVETIPAYKFCINIRQLYFASIISGATTDIFIVRFYQYTLRPFFRFRQDPKRIRLTGIVNTVLAFSFINIRPISIAIEAFRIPPCRISLPPQFVEAYIMESIVPHYFMDKFSLYAIITMNTAVIGAPSQSGIMVKG